jgi:KDO2-lipid IV(A) lauroyltransferase
MRIISGSFDYSLGKFSRRTWKDGSFLMPISGVARTINMNKALYLLARMAVAVLQALPLLWVARLGRCGGGVVFWLDARHREVALRNMTLSFQDAKSPREIRALAHENFRRIGENYACSVKTAGMSERELRKVVVVSGVGAAEAAQTGPLTECRIYATGHFGNFELFSRMSSFIGGYQVAATYRGLRPPALDHILLGLRQTSGTTMYERRTEADTLKKAMGEGGRLLILFSDQSVRENGMELPFLGRACWTSRAPAVMAMRYKTTLFVPICYRTSLGRWRIEVGEPIATHQDGLRRSVEAITRDMNTAMEVAIRRDPANWFWVHNRWKLRSVPEPIAKTEEPAALRASLRKNEI